MNDWMESIVDKNCEIKLYQELSTLWEKVNLHATKWLSNSAKVLEKVSAEDCSNEVNLSKISTTSENTWVTLDC